MIYIALFPALLLAQEDHKPVEITIDEFKTHPLGRQTPIRSPAQARAQRDRNADEVIDWLRNNAG